MHDVGLKECSQNPQAGRLLHWDGAEFVAPKLPIATLLCPLKFWSSLLLLSGG